MLPILSVWGKVMSERVDKLLTIKKTCSYVTLSPFASNLFTRLTRQLVNYRKLNSQTENQKGVNSVQINALLACKRCPLRPLLTPFWNPIKHLLVYDFITS